MDKSELIEALRETGIVSKENDANGVRVLLTVNDYETIKSKLETTKKDNNLKTAQFWGIIVTIICLIATTIWGVASTDKESVKYIPRSGYVLMITDNETKRCILPEVADRYMVKELVENIGIDVCQ